MPKRSALAFTLIMTGSLLLAGCTSAPETTPTAAPSLSIQPSTSASAPRPSSTSASTPKVTPTGKSVPVNSLIPKNSSTKVPTGKPSVIAKGSNLNLAAIAVAHWRKDSVVQPDTDTWRQSGSTGSMRGTVLNGPDTGKTYTFQLSKHGNAWQVDSAN